MGSHRKASGFLAFVGDLFRFYWLPTFIAVVLILGFAVAWSKFIG